MSADLSVLKWYANEWLTTHVSRNGNNWLAAFYQCDSYSGVVYSNNDLTKKWWKWRIHKLFLMLLKCNMALSAFIQWNCQCISLSQLEYMSWLKKIINIQLRAALFYSAFPVVHARIWGGRGQGMYWVCNSELKNFLINISIQSEVYVHSKLGIKKKCELHIVWILWDFPHFLPSGDSFSIACIYNFVIKCKHQKVIILWLLTTRKSDFKSSKS